MDTNSNQSQGTDLSLSAIAQGPATASQVVTAPLPAAPVNTVLAQPVDESATDDEIDQVWVSKAKDIVEQTKGDPFTMSKRLNEVKAHYLRVRFNKELKTDGKPSQ